MPHLLCDPSTGHLRRDSATGHLLRLPDTVSIWSQDAEHGSWTLRSSGLPWTTTYDGFLTPTQGYHAATWLLGCYIYTVAGTGPWSVQWLDEYSAWIKSGPSPIGYYARFDAWQPYFQVYVGTSAP